MAYSNSELLSALKGGESSEVETQYVLNNPELMRQISQIKKQGKQIDVGALQKLFDVEYILSNSDLIQQIQLLVEAHKKHAINSVSGRHITSL